MSDDDQSEQWSDEAISAMLRRQISELETIRNRLVGKGKNPDDNLQLRDTLFEIQHFKHILAEMERELGGESEGDDE